MHIVRKISSHYFMLFIIISSIIFFNPLHANNFVQNNEIIQANDRADYREINHRILTKFSKKLRFLSSILYKFSERDIKIYIYDAVSTIPAALSYPGRREIFISIELLQLINTEDEIAFIVAHEFSHILKNHVSSQKDKIALLNASKRMGSSNTPKNRLAFKEMKYMHNLEFIADKIALEITKNNNYSSSGSITVLKAIKNRVKNGITRTHPAISSRINKIQTLASYKNNRKQQILNSVFKEGLHDMSKYARGNSDIDMVAVQKALKFMGNYYKNK